MPRWRELARRGERLEPREQRLGLGAAVGLDAADDHVDALSAGAARGLEHGVGLADAGGGAEEDLQPAARRAAFALLGEHPLEQAVGVGPPSVHRRSGAGPWALLRRGRRAPG